MSQKILPKGETPATKIDVAEMIEQIRNTIATAYDPDVCKVAALVNAVSHQVSDEIMKSINRDIECRSTIRACFYRTFGAQITPKEIDDKGELKMQVKSRMFYLSYMHTRMTIFNSDKEYLTPAYKSEVDRLTADFNDAVNLIIMRYKEYLDETADYRSYEKSPVKGQIDRMMNVMYDVIRLYNRNYEYNMINTANQQ